MRLLRVMIELLHVAVGVLAALMIGGAAAWAYPVGRDNIWLVTWVSVAVVVLLGVRPVQRAARAARDE